MPRSSQASTTIAAFAIALLILMVGGVVALFASGVLSLKKRPAQVANRTQAPVEKQTAASEPEFYDIVPEEESPQEIIKQQFKRLAAEKQKKIEIEVGELTNGKISLPVNQSADDQYKAIVFAELKKHGYVSMAQSPKVWDYGFMITSARHANGSSASISAWASWKTWDDRRDWELKSIRVDNELVYGADE